jgi:hypothetical protein
MVLGLKRRLAAAGVAVVVAFIGAGTAAACHGGGGGDRAAMHNVLAAKFTMHHHHARHLGLLALPSAYLGLSKDAIKDQLESGKTLAQIADATPGKSAAGLVDFVVSHVKAKLDPWVAKGKLSQAQEDTWLAKTHDMVAAAITKTLMFHH